MHSIFLLHVALPMERKSEINYLCAHLQLPTTNLKFIKLQYLKHASMRRVFICSSSKFSSKHHPELARLKSLFQIHIMDGGIYLGVMQL
jgi:hypothetical protein